MRGYKSKQKRFFMQNDNNLKTWQGEKTKLYRAPEIS
jgi:hypothetical protein